MQPKHFPRVGLLGALAWFAASAWAATEFEGMILDLRVNQVPRGEFTLYRKADGDYLMRVLDLGRLGVQVPASAERKQIEGEEFLSLRGLGARTLSFDLKRLALGIELPPDLFAMSGYDLDSRKRGRSLASAGRSAFFNYRLATVDSGDQAPPVNSLATELGIRLGDVLFRNEGLASEGAKPRRFVTQLVYDRVADQQRYIAGDHMAYSGELGSSVSMAGLSLTKAYQMAPNLVRQPVAGFAGVATSPSRVEVRVGGVTVARQDVAPGPFELQNLRQYGGARDVEVVVRDALGREQTVTFPFYFSDQSLSEGLHEYSYSLGKIRLDSGADNDRYGPAAFSAFHRFGYNDFLTLGARSEISSRLRNVGAEAIVRHDRLGVLTSSLSLSQSAGNRNGAAALFSYAYLEKNYSVHAIVRRFGDTYRPLDDLISPFRRRGEYGGSFSWFIGNGSTLSVDRTVTAMRDQAPSHASRVSLSQTLGQSTSIFATLQRVSSESTRGTELFVGLMYRFDAKHTASVNSNRDSAGKRNLSTQLARNTPIGEGLGYRVGWNQTRPRDEQQITTYAQWNAPLASLTLDITDRRDAESKSSRSEAAVTGALAWADGAWGMTRQIGDSFAVVRVGSSLDGVRVHANSQEIGRTDGDGQLIVPNAAAFSESRISIEGKDVPLEYAMSRETQTITPAYRSGTLVDFGIRRINAVEGVINLRADKEPVAAENVTVHLTGADGRRQFMTGRGGRYYVEDLAAGDYRGEIRSPGRTCTFSLAVPGTEKTVGAIVTTLGASLCE